MPCLSMNYPAGDKSLILRSQTGRNVLGSIKQHAAFQKRNCSCNGILDSYREAQAVREEQQDLVTAPDVPPAAPAGYNQFMFESTDEDICPAECVVEVTTPREFKDKCQDAGDALVVLDLYKTSCGACKYLMPGFLNFCKDVYFEEQPPNVIFLKHNVFDDDEEEKTDLARRLRVQGVPKFMIFRNMELVDEFSTRDKQQLIQAVLKHTA